MSIAHIALPIPLANTFDYILPKNICVKSGCRVYIPFGNQHKIGIIVKISNKSKLPFYMLKKISKIIDDKPIFSVNIWQLLLWASDYYHYPIGCVLFYALPSLLRQGKSIHCKFPWYWLATEKGLRINIDNLNISIEHQRVLSVLRKRKIDQNQLNKLNINKYILNELEKMGLIKLLKIESDCFNWNKHSVNKCDISQLNFEQKMAVKRILNGIFDNFSVWLLSGSIGSGKTDVFLNVLKSFIIHGKQALVLVPEISITSKIISNFHKFFNVPIEIIHSKLNNKKHLKIWLKAKNGEIAIIIGTRSSLFTQFKNLGIIIIYQEHDSSYKQQKGGWRYHARDLAIYRAYNEHIPIILISATPTLETLYNVYINKYNLIHLKKHINNINPIFRYVIDLKNQQLQFGLSLFLIKRIKQHLLNNNQVILFFNRHGFAHTLICHYCGWIAKCNQCNHQYSLHQNQNKLFCYYCKNVTSILYQCYSCGSKCLLPLGIGMEQLESLLTSYFPNIPISCIDYNVIKNKENLEKKLSSICLSGAHILICTQMLMRGYHFLNATLIALLDVDNVLFSTNFRSLEHFSQLYTQIIGRFCSIDKQGEVILQTYYPENYLFKILLQYDYTKFAKYILIKRRMMKLPPWTKQAIIRTNDSSDKKSILFIQSLYNILKSKFFLDKQLWIINSILTLPSKKRGLYHYQILLQHPSRYRLQYIVKCILKFINNLPNSRKVKWILDIDPIDI